MFSQQQGGESAKMYHVAAQWTFKWSLKYRTVKISHNMETTHGVNLGKKKGKGKSVYT